MLLLFSWGAGVGVFVLMQMLMNNTSVPLGGHEPTLCEIMICTDTSVLATGGTCSVPGVAGILEPLPDRMVGTLSTHWESWGVLWHPWGVLRSRTFLFVGR